jgi:uncharacterized protein YihD (DUF1040 family)
VGSGLKRELSEMEKQKLLEKYGLKCFIDNHPVKSKEELEFHHITPFSEGGSTDLQNMAPVCKNHHRRIGTLSLSEFRDKLSMETFFEKKREAYLDDVIKWKLGENNFGKEVHYELTEENIKIYFINKGWETFPLHRCPVTNVNYFYATIPIGHLINDNELQPRFLIPGKLWALYSHFRRYTQLAPSICRLKDNKILLFDGQHKATAQIWLGRREVECKVYIDPNEVTIKEANIAAHTTLRQMSLYTSIAIRRLSDLYSDYWEEFEKLSGQKSEKLFVSFLESRGKKRREATDMFRAAIYDAILRSDNNKFAKYVSKATRTTDMPVSVFTLKRSILADFVVSPPLSENLELVDVWRENERKNVVKLLNILAEETLDGKWNPKSNDAQHRKAERIYRAGCVRTWSKMLKDIVAAVLGIFDTDKKERMFFDDISDDKWNDIRAKIKKFFSHKIWDDLSPGIDAQLKVNDISTIKQVFSKEGLTINWVLGLPV